MIENVVAKTIHIEVVLAMPDQQELLALDIASGSTVAEAIEQSALIDSFDGVELDLSMVGIFGHKVSAEQVLRDGDRVEIYRPLIADPKEVRRQRAIKQAEIDSE
jgi:putative ubiquitin-RnfH superfamily antitoxin RatB of RatAB toxin-antitoxin module